MPRFFIPGLALYSVWLGASLAELPAPRLRPLVIAGLLSLALNNVFWAAVVLHRTGAWRFTTGTQSKAEYLRHAHATYPTPYYAAAEWINGHTPPNARVLVIGDGRGLYLERPFRASSVYDTDLFLYRLRQSASAEELKRGLDREGLTHLLVNMGEILRITPPAGLSPEHLRVLERFLATYARMRFVDLSQDPRDFRWSLVYELTSRRIEPAEGESPLVWWYARQVKK